MIFFLYRHLILPATLLTLWLARPWWPTKLKRLFEERQSFLPGLGEGHEKVILVHAASGEIEYAKPVLRELRRRQPDWTLIVSYFSPSAHRLHASLDVDGIMPLPLDRPVEVGRFLDMVNPAAVLIARTDLWPEFLTQCRERGIPVTLFSATAPAKKGLWRQPLRRYALDQVHMICTVSDEDTEYYRKVTSTPVVTVGDTRYDQVVERLRRPRKIEVSHPVGDPRKVVVLGSTWPEEDELWLGLVGRFSNTRWIWAPHEFNEGKLASLQGRLEKVGLTWQLASAGGPWTHDVLIVDVIGILAELYTWGNAAFVGGSLQRKVHSVMEPLVAGLPVLLGPHHLNNREAIEFQKVLVAPGIAAVNVFHSAEEAAHRLEALLPLPPVGDQIRQEVESRTQATKRVLDLFLHRL